MNVTDLPLIGIVEWPATPLGRFPESMICPIVAEQLSILINRFCNINGVWSEPEYESCLQAIIDRDFDDISSRLNQVRYTPIEGPDPVKLMYSHR